MLIDLKPAAVEVWKGRTEFRVVNNDGTQESTVVFTGLKNLFKNSFP
jgi:histone acetyltransferase